MIICSKHQNPDPSSISQRSQQRPLGLGQGKAKFVHSLQLLEEYGLLLGEPWVKSIHGVAKLRELRFSTFGETYRFFFFPVAGRKLILLHGFKKKSQETPKRELHTAETRMKDYIQRHGGRL